MNYLVTGATGFVGTNLVRELINIKNAKVSVTARANSDFAGLSDVLSELQKIYFVDLSNRDAALDIIQKSKPNIIYHLAASGVTDHETDSELMLKTNLFSTKNLLDAAVATGVEQFINTGSSSEYGSKDHPMREDDSCEPLSFYGFSKLAATNYCGLIGRSQNYPVCTLRLFSPYGNYDHPTRLYPTIINALNNGKPPRLSNPDSVRDFIEVDKVVNAYLKLRNCHYQPGDIVNIGSGRQQTIAEFYRGIARQLKTNIEPVWAQDAPHRLEPKTWEADISKWKALMGAAPRR